MTGDQVIAEIKKELDEAPAADVADAFLSPHIDREFFLKALEEEGPSMWIVNRSDVWSETLQFLTSHPIPFIAQRAQDKLKQRGSKLFGFGPPKLPANMAEIGDESVEDVLGHPLVPFEAILFFSHSLNEDHRGSAALSLTRRLLEYPPNWFEERISQTKLVDRFAALLMEDPSSFVRSYAARIPLFDAGVLREAFKREKNSTVLARLLQHPATATAMIEETLNNEEFIAAHDTPSFVAALDRRVEISTRKKSLQFQAIPSITRRVHEWYLERYCKL
jgi:hypothetical protein